MVRGRLAAVVLAAVARTLVVVVLALNLSSGECKIQHWIGHLYDVGDAQFVRTMGNLLRVDIFVPGPINDAEVTRKASRARSETFWKPESRSPSTSRRCTTARS